MADEPRKFPQIEPDIRPNFGVNGESAKALDSQESHPNKVSDGESLYDKESNGSNVTKKPEWTNNVIGKSPVPTGLKAFGKKRGPLMAIILLLFGGFFGITAFIVPGGVVFQFVATEVGHFNTQLGSMDARTVSLYNDKTTSGFACGSVISIGCKYSTMSDTQVKNFDDAGITVNSESKTIFGRTKPTSFEFNGETIEAGDFKNALKNNPDFAQAVDDAYNPKFAGFSDNVFVNWVAEKLGISKAAETLDGSTDAEELASLESDIKTPADTSGTIPSVGENNPATNQPYTAEDIKALTANNSDIANGAADAASAGEATADSALAVAEETVSKAGWSATDTISVLGYTHAACAVYSSVQALGFAAKTVRSLQLDRYGWALLNQESQARAGVATEKGMAFWGDVLTQQDKDGKSATDSYGYGVSGNGVAGAGTMPTSTTRYLAGGGLTGSLLGVTAGLNKLLLNAPKKTCGIVNNPIVIGGSLALGVASILIPLVREARLPEITWQAGAVASLYVASAVLPHMLKDIVAGVVVDKTTVGASAGDALTSGISGVMSKSAQGGGNAPLTPNQAVAYNEYSSDVAAKYEAHERLAYSPLDATHSSTFMGKIFASLMPYISKLSSLSGVINSIASVTTNSLSSIVSPMTHAASTADYTQCQDEDYKALGVATDPFCNVTYGIPPSALNADPIKVANTLVAQGQIDPQTGEPTGTEYTNFISNCINRDTTKNPLGDMGAHGSITNGQECLFGKKVAGTNYTNDNFYIHYIDQRVQDDMDGKDVVTASSSSLTTTPVSNYNDGGVSSGDVKYCTENYLKYTSQSDLKRIYGSSASEVQKNLVDVSFPLKNGTAKVQFNKKAAPCLKAVVQDLSAVKFRPTTFDGSFNWRANRNAASQLSNHSFGIALDLDASKNPNGSGSPGHCTTNMPADFVNVFKKYGFRWGGDFKSTCDAMHFEWLGGS